MNRITSFVSILFAVVFLFTDCSKPNDNNTPTPTPVVYKPSAFADSLKSVCTQPFTGAGDSTNFYLPTAFTPNADGINDSYKIIGMNNNFSAFMLSVYDTTGKLVFSTNSPTTNWTGADTLTNANYTKYKFFVLVNYTTLGGKTASKGTYVFVLSANTATRCINRVIADTVLYEFGDQFNPATGFNAAFNSMETFCN
jgi:gliding motility-associated-like protein